MDQFWLSGEQFATIAPHLPTNARGRPRVDDRRATSGIIHVLKSGGRWVDAPALYGPQKTLYDRFVRWAAKGVWVDLFQTLAQAGGPPAQVLIRLLRREGAPLRLGRPRGSTPKPSGARGAGARPRSTRSPTGSADRSPSF